LGVGHEANNLHTVKIKLFKNPEEGQGSQRAVVPVMMNKRNNNKKKTCLDSRLVTDLMLPVAVLPWG
jgi:hypothetical protein